MTSTTRTISAIAGEAYDAFESFKREGSDETIYKLRDGSPEWMTAMVHAAHGDMLPDGWRYEAIMDACSAIHDSGAESDSDLDDVDHEFADGNVDVYNHDRVRWLGSHLDRGGYVNQAVEEFGHSDQGVYGDIGLGQYVELQEIFASVRQSLSDRLDELEAEEDDAEI